MLQWWEATPAIDTLRLATREYCGVMARLCMNTGQHAGVSHNRRHQRVHYRRKAVKVLFHRESATNVPYLVKSHNLSASGIAFLHGFFVQTGTICDVALARADRQITSVSGRVVRCRFLGGRVHEIGVEFSQPLDLGRYVADGAQAQPDAPGHDKPPQFVGRLLYLDDCAEDRELVAFLARQLGIEVCATSAAIEALRRVEKEPFDLVVAKTHLLAESGTSLVEMLQRRGYGGPVVAVSAAGEVSSEAVVMAGGCDCVVSAPITTDRLVDLFRGYLAPREEAKAASETLLSSRWSEVALQPLILKYVDALHAHVGRLQELLNQNDLDGFKQASRQLAGSATNYGFEPIARALAGLQALVEAGEPKSRLAARMSEVARLCAAARMVKARRT